ncbi:hypothetical protein [Runella sp.]|uniref:hypothetical protein n=1 Tax=Runella sp. TaxID=1960881 RepID=UPI0026378C0D|nr:hypothetical protein [Runella sp.]
MKKSLPPLFLLGISFLFSTCQEIEPACDFNIQSNQTSIKADGESTINVYVNLPDNTSENTEVKFRTTHGFFDGAATATPKEVSRKVVQVNENGVLRKKAWALLKSGTEPVDTVKVTAWIESKCEDSESFKFIYDSPPAITLIPPSDSILADGESTTSITAEIPLNTSTPRSTITFRTDKGVFEATNSATITQTAQIVNGKKQAKITFKSPLSVGIAKIKASILSSEKEMEIKLKNAPPDKIKIKTDKILIQKLEDIVTFTVELKRNSGKPSIGNKVTLTVTDEQNNREYTNNFLERNEESDANALCTFKFSLIEKLDPTVKQLKVIAKSNALGVADDSIIISVKIL